MHFIGENWEMIKQTIHTEYDLTNISYNTWIEPLQFYDVKDDTVYIQIPTGQAHALNYISNKYSNYFKVTISEMMDHDYDISFILEKEKAADTDTDLKSPSSNINNINYEQANCGISRKCLQSAVYLWRCRSGKDASDAFHRSLHPGAESEYEGSLCHFGILYQRSNRIHPKR